MVDQVEIVTFTTPAAPGTLDVTHPKITETFSAAILIFTKETDDDSSKTHSVIGIGFIGIEPTLGQESVLHLIQESGLSAVPDNETGHASATDADPDCLRSSDGQTLLTYVIQAKYSSSIAGGVKLNFTTTTVQAKCTAILFAGLARAAVGECSSSTTGVAEAVGESGNNFRPHIVVFCSSDSTVNSSRISDASLNLGFALDLGGTPQMCAYSNTDDGGTVTDADAAVGDGVSYVILGGARGIQTVTVAFTSTGFTATSSTLAPKANYLALKFSDLSRVRFAIANFSVAASTGLQSFNAFGFTPHVVLGMATLLTSTNTLVDGATAAVSGLCAFGPDYERAYAIRYREGITVAVDPTEASTRQGDHALLLMDHLGAVVQEAEWAGPSGNGGFRLNFGTGSAAGTLTALGIQIIPEPPRPLQRRRALRRRRTQRALRRSTPLSAPPPGAPPLSRLFRAVARFRRKFQERLRWRPFHVPTETPVIGMTLPDAPKGRIAQPGLLRGRIVGATLKEPENT